jgi:hypothetical protein
MGAPREQGAFELLPEQGQKSSELWVTKVQSSPVIGAIKPQSFQGAVLEWTTWAGIEKLASCAISNKLSLGENFHVFRTFRCTIWQNVFEVFLLGKI